MIKVKRHIGFVGYLLDLLASVKLHLVFHVSLLCHYIGPPPIAPATLPKEVCPIKEDLEFLVTEEEIVFFESPHSSDA